MLRACAALLVLTGAACGNASDADRPGQAAVPEQPASSEVAPTYAPALDVDIARMTRTASGLHVEDVQEGSGRAAAPGDIIVVHYTGWLADGTRFDSSRDSDTPYTLAIGTGEVIPGWDEGIPGMQVGGVRRLVIPPSLAYGNQGAGGVIPPGATLIFEVELLEIL
jgi:FKBP-type peptidyl-prolyl cis-trans isomerase FkpA